MASLSGTVAFAPPTSDLTIEAFARMQIRPSEFTQDHLASARMSFNLTNVIFSNRGINLWKIVPEQIYLPPGVTTYQLDPSTIMIEPEAFVRTYTLSVATNITPQFTTSSGSASILVWWPSHGQSVGSWVNINTYISVGGIVVYSFYQVTTVPDVDHFTITADTATATVTDGGVTPQYQTFEGDPTAEVLLPNHGFAGGEQFNANVPTTVGGVTIYGPYVIASIVDADTFIITLSQPAFTDDTGYENDGLVQMMGQSQTVSPTDRVIYPLSRADYAALPNKLQTGLPTQYWFDRTTTPTVTIWPVPDGNGPYQLNIYRFVQMDDVNVRGNELADVPFRFIEAYIAAVSAHLSMKWKPDMFQMLAGYAQSMFQEASDADREKVPFFATPSLEGYFS